ncbi:MAG: beta-galactosidase [Bacteroidales bacterium]|nr:beta-galactosidase [Bacteroidales bacterium]
MKYPALSAIAFLLFFYCNAQTWHPAGDKIKTPWADQVDPANPLPEYPRPLLEREQWKNLNGFWDYIILPKGSSMPDSFEGKILVPFAVESSLSGVQKKVGAENELWYSRSFAVPASWKEKTILLNFGAVDWKCDIWINDIHIGSHQGGYTPFRFDITPFLVKGSPQRVMVRVWDPTNTGFQPRGKQVNEPRGIWYTAVTGIWQTVWLEPVGKHYITSVKTIPDIDGKSLSVTAVSSNPSAGDFTEVTLLDQGTVIASGKAAAGTEVLLSVPGPKLWSPESPFLYDIEITLNRDGKVLDQIRSYAGMRKISIKKDELGVWRMQLNNEDYFQFGLLDQGWWPDGLYTAPTDEALKYDIVTAKSLGYNLIRKHVKVEPARWYYHCDKEGILVWQDMPSGDRGPQWQPGQYFTGQEKLRSPESADTYMNEWKAILDKLISNPSVVSWVPFNESWGQFNTVEIAQWTKSYDPSRLVNPASGGNFYAVGDILDVHNYPDPQLTLYDGSRVNVLGEYGGLGLAVEGHLWETGRNWGYVQYKTTDEVTDAYIELAEKLKKLIKPGFSAAIYTQTTDVEIEVNGIMTYDRKVVKLDADRIRKVNREICDMLSSEVAK